MRRISVHALTLTLLLGGSLSVARAQEAAAEESGAMAKEEKADVEIARERQSVTRHSAVIGGQRIDYTVEAGTILLQKEDESKKATIFYIAYTRDGIEDDSARPITFSFNGGPGSASVWLHLGLLGPKRPEMTDEGFPVPPPYKLEDNPHSLLDVTDMVFIDPVSTGFSRAVPGEEAQQFHGQREDVESVGEFVRRWVNRNGRWDSPKFLIGESYGTTRAAALVNYLQARHGMYFNGVMLVSSILNFETARFDVGNDLPYPLYLPTYAATAWYHHRLDPSFDDLRSLLGEVEEFARGEYTLALTAGDDLAPEARRSVVEKLARYTGLSTDYIEATNLRPVIFRFVKELMRDERLVVGRLDSRFTGSDRDAAGEGFERDPSYSAIQGSFTAALNKYVREDLGFESHLDYEILGGRIHEWNYSNFSGRYVNVADDLRQAMVQNENLKVHVANGYYDLATPYFATEYTFAHLGLPERLRGNVSMSFYEGGHMMYIRKADLVSLRGRLAEFIADAM